MKRKLIVALVATVVVAVGATASVVVVQQRAEAARVAEDEARERKAERERLAALAEAQAAHEECVTTTADYLAAVQDVDAVVSVDVNLQDYGDLVRDAAMAQRRLGPASPACRSGVVDPLDDAMAECSNLSGDERVTCWADIDRQLMEEVVPFVPYVFDNNVDITSQRVLNYTFDQFAGLAAWDKMALDPSTFEA